MTDSSIGGVSFGADEETRLLLYAAYSVPRQ